MRNRRITSLFTTAFLGLLAIQVQSEQVVISEIMYHPAGDLPEYIEIYNHTATPFDMAAWKLRGGVDYDFPDFSAAAPDATFLPPYERLVLCGVEPATLRSAYGMSAGVVVLGPWTGSLDNGGERITLKDKNGVTLCTVQYNDRGRWPLAADGAGHSLVLVNPNTRIDDWRNWKASQRVGGTPGTDPISEPELSIANPEINLSQGIPFVNYGDAWRYHDQNMDLGTSWREVDFVDTAWASGPGLFGFESAALPAPGIQTPLFNDSDANNLITYYFRKEFTYSGSRQGVTVTLDQILDDGAIYYLNGQEMGRNNMPGGTVDWKTTASGAVGDATESLNVITTSGSLLRDGRNVLAVELHQVNSTSSDAVFGCRLKISVPSQPSLIINEVLPAGTGIGFVEFYNPGAAPIDLLNHYLADNPANLTKHRITSSIVVPAGGFASVGFTESGLTLGDPVTVYLTAPDGATAINAIRASVPLDGRSFGRKPAGSANWFLFADATRNEPNASQSSLAEALRLNEVHFNALNQIDWVEFYNTGGDVLTLDGLFLSTQPDFSDKIPLSGTVPAGGFVSRDVMLATDNGEVDLYLVTGGKVVLFAGSFSKTGLGDSLQAFPDGVNEWFGAAMASQGAANHPARNTDIVINEIMYDPPSDEVSGEYVELFNRGNVTVDVSHWRFVDGLNFTIPPGTMIPAGGYLVVAADRAWMQSAYGAIPMVGDFSGRLSNNGDLIRLEDAWGNLVDEVDYQPGGNWPNLANGDGSSMELRNPWMDNGLASAWSDSYETNKSAFQTYRYQDVFRQLRADGAVTDYKELHFHLVGDSHVVLNNIQLRQNGTGANLIQNANQMSTDCCSASGWLAQGTHYASHLENGQLHLIADGHGDNRANRVEIDATGMTSGQSYEISFEARWVSGAPRLVVQTWDHSIATSIALEVPKNLGTPGSINSKFIGSPAPQVDELRHRPAVPAAGEPVLVTARITSATPNPEVRLFHRLDNNNGDGAWTSKLMYDDGVSGGDAVAGDGIYTATLTEYAGNGQIAQFYVRAQASGYASQMPKWGPDRPAMVVVDTPSTVGDLRRMRFVVSAFDVRAISNQDSPTGSYGYAFPRLANHYFNMTLIINERDVIYNCEIRNSGSPWTRGGGLDRGKFKLPKDQLYRGKLKLSYDNDAGGGSRHHNRITRHWLYLLGHPANENEYVQIEVNNGGSALREEVEPVGNDMMDRIYENGSRGDLYRIDDEWWFTDGWGRNSRNADWSYKGTDNAGRYRTEWIKRTREDEDDFAALISMFKKINSSYTQTEIEQLIDPLAVMKMSAVRGYIYDWDSFSLNRGKNGYLYRRSTDGRFMFFHWDSDLAFQDANNIFYNGMAGFRPYLLQTYNFRLFKHYLARMVEEFTRNSPRIDAWLQAEENASSQYTVSGTYQTWFVNRETPANNLLGANRTLAFNITSNGGNPITTSAATVNLTGTAPLRVFKVGAEGHSEAVFAWTSESTWTLSGILLQTGVNVLTLQAMDEDGRVFHTDTITVTKNGNALPVMALEADPASWHVSILETLELDASASRDPDGTPLTFVWNVNPTDAQMESDGDHATATFPRPGLYTFSVTGMDAEGGAATMQREAAVYAPDGFSPFNDPQLETYWNLDNVELRRNFSKGPYYSVTEESGSLILHVLDDRARPLDGTSPLYPWIWRALPANGDWAFLTKVEVRGQVFGDYMAGVMVEMNESGAARYVFGIENGGMLAVKRVSATGTVSTLRTTTLTGKEATVRIRRGGNSLYFETLIDEVWTVVHTTGLPQGATAQRGGLFVSTDVAQIIKAAFDYALLVDPSSTSDLRESLRVSEIMYNPVGGSDYEFIELVNIGETPLDLTGVRFTAGIDYTFGITILGPGQYLLVVKNQAAFASRYDISGLSVAPNEFAGRLDNAGETIELSDAQGVLILSVTYQDSGSWPSGANGSGSSLEVIDAAGNLNDGGNWRASPENNGSPGRAGGNTLGRVVVNEVLTHTDFPLEDAIELFNRTRMPVDLGGWFLSDAQSQPKKYRIPEGTILPPQGYAVFYEVDFNTNNNLVPFSLSSVRGDEVYLSAADAAGNLSGYQQSVAFDAAANGVSFGRYETSDGVDYPPLAERTFGMDAPADYEQFRSGTGLANAGPRVGPVVINEIMYHPPDLEGGADNEGEEYVELHNVTAASVALYDPAYPTNTWRLRGGVDFDLPMGVSLPARGYLLLVPFDPVTHATELATFRAKYALPVNVTILGPYSGKLENDGEAIKLVRPDTPQGPGPDQGFVPYLLVDRVHYRDTTPWPVTADGGGDSLQRRRPFAYGNDSANWKGTIPTPGRANVAGNDFTDSDLDGLTDSYELAHGFNPNDAADAGLDFDGDGKTNEEEFLDGTDPKNSADRWRAPQITQQPAAVTAPIGGTANFRVMGTGTGILHYQWRIDGLALAGATNDTLTIASVQSAAVGEYSVVVRNEDGFVISDSVPLQVLQPLVIVGQPLSQLVDRGGSVTFAVFASGTGILNYQWRFNGMEIPGATSSVLMLTDVQLEDGGNYTVTVTDDNGSLDSAEATLSVLTPPVITQHPRSQSVVAYNDIFLTVSAGGQGPFAYQWRFNGILIPGATNSVLALSNVQPNQGGHYSVEVFNPVSSTVSESALLTVLIPAAITLQPAGGTVNPGENYTFTVAATSSTPITYQWRFNDVDIPGATGASYSVTNVQEEDGGNYQAIVTDGIGSVRSDIAVLTVLVAPSVVVAPVSQSAVIGGSVTFSIETRGGLPMGYRWRRSGSTLTNFVLSSHKAFLTIRNLTANDAGNYTVVLTNAASYQPGILSPAGSLMILADADGDLMSDAWENGYGFDPMDPADAGLDFDGDGLTNREEHDSGTDPKDAASYLRLETLRTEGGVTLQFPGASNQTYTVEYTDLLGSGFWRKLDDAVARATNRVEILRDPQPRVERYYRIVTPRRGEE